jgi:hypothetical protein
MGRENEHEFDKKIFCKRINDDLGRKIQTMGTGDHLSGVRKKDGTHRMDRLRNAL